MGTGPFNVNELLAMLRLLRYVCSHKDAELARFVKRAHASGQIMVPDSDCCLVATSACVHTHGCPPQLLARSDADPRSVTDCTLLYGLHFPCYTILMFVPDSNCWLVATSACVHTHGC